MDINDMSDDVWIVIPAYNEGSVIGDVLTDLIPLGSSIVVVDDCSSDDTLLTALSYPVIVLHHSVNLGQGAALQTGFSYVIKKTNAKYVITFDSDGQHDAADIEKILLSLVSGNLDVVLGSRFINNSRIEGISPFKYFTLKAGVLFTKLSTKLNVTDTHNGLRGFTITALKEIHITQNRMAHASEILSQIAAKKMRWQEVPVTIRYTEYSKKKGQSVLNAINILWDLFFERY